MTENDSLFSDFYDCNSSSNSFLKFETNSPLFELSPESTGRVSPPSPSPSPIASTTNSNDKMDSSHNNPLLSTASMPIPTRNISLNSTANSNNNRIINDFSEVIFDFENSRSPLSAISEHPRQHQTPMMINYSDSNTLGYQQNDAFNTGVMWDNVSPMMNVHVDSNGTSVVDINDKPFRMDEDDIFQVDKSDLIQDPTLAELNGGDGNLYVDLLNIEELIANDSSNYMQQCNMQNLTQLSSVNFQNLQNAIEASQADQLSPTQYQTIAIPQTPHNTPIPSFHTSGGKIIFCDDSLFSPTNQLTISTNIQNVASNSQLAAFSPESHSSTSTSSIALNSSLSPPPSQTNYTPTRVRQPRVARGGGAVQYNPKYSTLHSLLLKKDPSNTDKDLLRKIQQASQNQPSSSTGSSSRRLQLQSGGFSRLSSSAPTSGFEQIWQRREPKPHLLSTGSLAEGQGSTSSLSGDVLSPENIDYSQDDDYSDEDSDHYEDYSSDSDNEDNKSGVRGMANNDSNNNQKYSGSKKSRFFWQYNVQAKGPKGQRLIIKTQAEDPHCLNEATDPVFSPSCSVRGIKSVQIKHSGKARKGDGNDLTPNAKKLTAIGKELDKLGKVINEITPVSELPFNVRPKTRKEKNKLASRACRLKKKAQHEANKIKLYGLEHEHKSLILGINHLKQLVAMKCSSSQENQSEINERVEQVVAEATRVRIADNSTDYVNRVLDRMKSGIPGGGLDDF